MSTKAKLFIISGPSGVGKTSLVTALLASSSVAHLVKRVVTYTTKPPRIGEIPGVDYYFMSEQEFLEKIQEDFFIEWSTAYGHYYGSPWSVLNSIKMGNSSLLIIDRVGAQKVVMAYQPAVTIWIYPVTIEELTTRLAGRKTEVPEAMVRRIQQAEREIRQETICRLYQYHICNKSFRKALGELEQVISNELEFIVAG